MRPEPTTSQRRRRRQASQISNLQAEIHGELFSLERLEEYARELATQHKAITRRVPARPLLAEAEKSGRKLEEAYTRLAEATGQNAVLMPGDEWLLDNYHIVRDTVDEIEVDLPRRYYLQLPRLGEGVWTGYPRVYSLVRELILHSDGIVDGANVEAFTRGYQSVLTLDLGELWALPAMIRLALVENLARLADLILDARRQLEAANAWADRLIAMIEDPSLPSGATIGVPAELRRNIEQITPAFVARLVLRSREAGPAAAAWLGWLESELSNAGYSPEDAIRIEFSRQAALQASVGNTISSMRRVSATNWDNFVERQSAVEALLRTDPAGVYAQMDFSTRDRYRHTVERIARRAGKPEVSVAEQALRFAMTAKEENPDDVRRSHVGYYLVARGVHQVRAAVGYKSRLGETLSRFVRAYPTAVYIGSILGLTLACLLALRIFGFGSDLQAYSLWAGIVLLIAILP